MILEEGVYDIPADGVCRIPLGKDYEAIVDAVDYPAVAQYKWAPLFGHNGKVYAVATGLRNGRRSAVYMHRIVAGSQGTQETDHRDGDGLNNRRANLRPATPSQNRANMGKPRRPDGSSHSSRFKGVSWDKSRGRWQAKIQVNGRTRNLGRYDAEVDAAKAYDAAAATAWGDFARINFPTKAAA